MATKQWPSLSDLIDDGESPAEGLHGNVAAFDAAAASATELLLEGLQVARSGELDAAAELFAKAIVKEPDTAEAYEALATVLIPMGQLEFAARAKGKAISLGYNSASSWEMLGDIFINLGQFDEAAEAYTTALGLEPNALALHSKLQSAVSQQSARLKSAATSPPAAQPAALPDADLFGLEFLSNDLIPPAWRQVTIVTITPEGNPHSAAFDDLTLCFESAFRSLGVDVQRKTNALGNSGINLLLGAHLIDSQELADRIPSNTVIVNLEQVTGFDVRSRPVYLSLLSRLAVWDYSVRNIEALRRLTGSRYARHFSIGYTPEMTRNLPRTEQSTDVLFYGSLNPRRQAVLAGLVAAGLNVKHLFSVYGEARDRAIAEAKVVLNVHFYEDSIHEIVRTSYLLANRKAVVSECGPRTEIDEDIRSAMLAVPYDDIVRTCVALVLDELRRRELERRGFEVFATRDQARILRETIAATEMPNFG
ncbi:tetratricopeptide repeat protein [Hyphomicrobium sp.]|uniref:tetratricopeptide repeat protein n=1 Tax=Hyphomicrobium sp. TaxID=82 RepID=UPI001DA80E31|nr:tetratricopeptide repeat protein [Hyphomicrobium sp.]MBY0558650.1 tetratricopeptide repeat protein [Hyphomicrobium sp.]